MKSQKCPKHIAIILDGNRRFAKRLMLEPWKGHEFGKRKVEKLIEWCVDLGIKEVTLYAFSMQNLNRPKQEYDYLMNVFIDAFEGIYIDKRVEEYGIKVNLLGDYKIFPLRLVKIIEKVKEKTKNNKEFILNFAMAYGGREEIVRAVKKIAAKKLTPEQITEKIIAQHLYTDSEPDLIIRTGGEHRTSNFLLWQSHYSELFFIDKTWPEFEKKDLIAVLKEYSDRDRRFGK